MSLERLKYLPYYAVHTHPKKWTAGGVEIDTSGVEIDTSDYYAWRTPLISQPLERYVYLSQTVLDSDVIMTAHSKGVPILTTDIYLRDTCTIGFVFPHPQRERIFGSREYTTPSWVNKKLGPRHSYLVNSSHLVELSNITKELYDSRIKELIEKIKNEKRI